MDPADVRRGMRTLAWIPAVLLLAGAIFVVDAVLRGGASVALVVVIPIVFGASIEFFAGVVLLFFGFVTLPLAWGMGIEGSPPDARRPPHVETPPTEVGGLILIGPLPIFFGEWRGVSRRTRVAAAVVGAAILVVLVVAFLVVR